MTAAREEALLLTPLLEALFGSGALAASGVRIDVISPPFACAGIGMLRIVRAEGSGDTMRLVAAYEGYEKL